MSGSRCAGRGARKVPPPRLRRPASCSDQRSHATSHSLCTLITGAHVRAGTHASDAPERHVTRAQPKLRVKAASPTGVKTHGSTAERREWHPGESSAQNTSSHRPGGRPSRLTLLGRITQQYVFLWLINLNGWLRRALAQ